jgi:hypothetical protein
MATYTYSPSSATSETPTSVENQSRSQMLRPSPNKSKLKTLRYETVAPRFVNIRHIPKENGGFTFEYNVQNAKFIHKKKPTLQFIELSKLVTPVNLNS